MKTTFEENLALIAARVKGDARKATKYPITSILSLCVVAGIAATVASFAHTNYYGLDDLKYVGTVAGPAVGPAALPAERTLKDTQGRALAGNVISKTDKSIQFLRTSDQQEFTIPRNSLSEADRNWLNGTAATQPKPELRKSTAKINVSIWKDQHNTYGTINVGDDIQVLRESDKWLTLEYLGSEILVQKGLAEVTSTPAGGRPARYMEDQILAIELLQRHDPIVTSDWARIHENEPKYANQRHYKIPLLESINPKPPGTAESVSLRPEFEKLGVKPLHQIGGTCAIYAARHIMDFYTKKGLAPVIDFDKIKSRIDRQDAQRDSENPKEAAERDLRRAKLGIEKGYSYSQIIRYVGDSVPKLVNNEWGDMPALVEFIKHEIRNGRPVSITGVVFKHGQGYGHQQIVVGFKTPDQGHASTELQVLDSNAAGYIWISANDASDPASINFQ